CRMAHSLRQQLPHGHRELRQERRHLRDRPRNSQFGSLTGVTELDAAIFDPLISQMALSPILRR
ncbi:MAG: hypothetical protein ACXW19_05000, partial [Thermoanaerobaculia bacterium]